MNTIQEVTVKNSGATFTPTALANFLSEKILTYYEKLSAHTTVLDPACGDGALLSSIALKINKSFDFDLRGYDTNINYILETQNRLLELGLSEPQIQQRDFLEVSPNSTGLFSDEILHEFADIVIANPPYVRTQILGAQKSQQIAKDYNLTGRVDLYYPFLIGMTNALKKGGIIGVITSNRYFTTKSGAEVRKFLLENYDILEIIDLGDTKIFDAAVLPAIFIGKKKANKKQLTKPCMFGKIYEYLQPQTPTNFVKVNSIFDILRQNESGLFKVNDKIFDYSVGLFKHSHVKTDVWQMTNEQENKWIETIQSNTAFYIGDRFKVRVGIKSCADNVFLNANWEKENFVPEKELLLPLISQENIKKWSCTLLDYAHVLYPHYSENGKRKVVDIEKYPNAKEYLTKHKDQLQARKYLIGAGRKWYEMWVPQNPSLWKFPKIVFPDISLEARFSYDESGAIVNGNCYWFVAQSQEEMELLFLIQGICNSDLMAQYHDLCFNNKLYSGRRRYLTQYIEKYPIPNPETKAAKRIVEIVKQFNFQAINNDIDCLTEELNKNVREAFKIMD
jgi:type I restriction-modification system DNA methylase subunit